MKATLAVMVLAIGIIGCGASNDGTTETAPPSSEQFLVYFGATGEDSEGIYAARFDAGSGELTSRRLAAKGLPAGFFEIHPNENLLYAAQSTPRDAEDAWRGVSAYQIDHATGDLTLLNRVPVVGQVHVAIDSQGRTVAVADYGEATVASMPIDAASGQVGEPVSNFQHEGSSVNPRRQQSAHAHSVNFSPDDQYLFVADLGTDKIVIYKHDPATSKLEEHGFVKVAPGGGPRHFTFHPNGGRAYVINELNGTITGFNWNAAEGKLEEFQTIGTLPEGFSEQNTTAEILIHPSGKFLYGSNRGHDSIAVFSIDETTGELAFVEHATEGIAQPRNFRLDPTGSFLICANQRASNVNVFRIDQSTGRLTPTGAVMEVPRPICVRFVRAK